MYTCACDVLCTLTIDVSVSLQPDDVRRLKAEALAIDAASALNLEQVNWEVGCTALKVPLSHPTHTGDPSSVLQESLCLMQCALSRSSYTCHCPHCLIKCYNIFHISARHHHTAVLTTILASILTCTHLTHSFTLIHAKDHTRFPTLDVAPPVSYMHFHSYWHPPPLQSLLLPSPPSLPLLPHPFLPPPLPLSYSHPHPGPSLPLLQGSPISIDQYVEWTNSAAPLSTALITILSQVTGHH